jgi:hypothetical protein
VAVDDTPDESRSSAQADRVVWSAVGILSAGQDISIAEALYDLCERARDLEVSPRDVAGFVEWRGRLPV